MSSLQADYGAVLAHREALEIVVDEGADAAHIEQGNDKQQNRGRGVLHRGVEVHLPRHIAFNQLPVTVGQQRPQVFPCIVLLFTAHLRIS